MLSKEKSLGLIPYTTVAPHSPHHRRLSRYSAVLKCKSKKLRGFDLLTCQKVNEAIETTKVRIQLATESYNNGALVD